MKDKLADIRSAAEALNLLAENTENSEYHTEIIFDVLEALEPLFDHLENYDDFDSETWTEELRQMIAELDD